MALKFKFKSREEIPAELQSLYVEREGAFVLEPTWQCEVVETHPGLDAYLAGCGEHLEVALDLDLVSVLFPVWQACAAVGLAQALRRTMLS